MSCALNKILIFHTVYFVLKIWPHRQTQHWTR